MKKWIKRIALIVIALLLVVILIVALTLDGIVRRAVEVIGTQSVHQTTTVEAADLSILGGKVGLSGMTIANPKEFSSPEFLKLKQIDIAVQSSSLLGDTIIVNDIKIQNLHLNLEQSGLSNNVNTILGEIKKQKQTDDSTGAKSGSSRQLKVKKITLKDTTVQMNVGLAGQKSQGVAITIPEMVLEDPNNPDGRVMKAADLIGQILAGVMQQVQKNANLPPELKNAVNDSVKFAGDNLGKAFNDIGTFGQGATTQLGKPVNDALKGVGDMFKKK